MKIILAAHGNLASGIKSSLNILNGSSDAVIALDAYVDEKDFNDLLDSTLDLFPDEDQIILLADIAFGSVSQTMMQRLIQKNLVLIAGFNLPLVLELMTRDSYLNEEELKEIIQKAQESLKLITLDEETSAEEFF